MRRRFGRGLGRPLRRMFRSAVPPLLIQSNALLSSGNYDQAADGLERLARAAEAHGGRRGSRRAGSLYLQAGQARLFSADPARGMDLVRAGFGLLVATGLALTASRAGRRIVGELRSRGLSQEAQQITAMLQELGPDADAMDIEAAPARRPLLPTHCPACGAPMRPDEVEWLDDATAECDYCGNPVRTEGA